MESRTRFVTAAAVAALLITAPALAAKVYRWVDEDGNVHYTESLPPGYKDTGHDVLNEHGLVVDENLKLTPEPVVEKKSEDQQKAEEANELPRDSSGLPRPKPLYTEAEKQLRMDNFLMLRYENEQEIIDAMNVEIKQLNYDRDLLRGSLDSLEEAYRGQIRVAANQQRAGQAVGDEAAREMAGLKSRMAKNARELAALDLREKRIREEFQVQLERYRFLLEKYAEEGHGS
jgi:hypothetical protein